MPAPPPPSAPPVGERRGEESCTAVGSVDGMYDCSGAAAALAAAG